MSIRLPASALPVVLSLSFALASFNGLQAKTLTGSVEQKEILPVINFTALQPQMDTSGLSFRENCMKFNPQNVALVQKNNRWVILEDFKNSDRWLFDFGDKQEAANQALNTIRRYGFNKYCRCGKGAYGMQYFLVDDKAPEGPADIGAVEDSLPVQQDTVKAAFVANRWKVVQGANGEEWMLDFGNDEQAARQAAEVIKHYGFTSQVFFGRPGAPVQYFRR